MGTFPTAILVAVAVWWAATGAVFLAVRLGGTRVNRVLVGATVMASAGFAGLYFSASMQSVAGTYLAFASAIAVWAWHETAFLLGFLTGPRKTPCPEGLSGFRRFRAAFETIRDHELALAATIAVCAVAIWQQPNRFGLWTLILLWVMRISTKLNIFLGAPNSLNELLPKRLGHLTSYFRTDSINPFFSMTLAAAVMVFGAATHQAYLAAAAHAAAGWTLLAVFAALAIVEHLFLVLPIRDSALWTWLLPADRPAAGDESVAGKDPISKSGGMSWT